MPARAGWICGRSRRLWGWERATEGRTVTCERSKALTPMMLTYSWCIDHRFGAMAICTSTRSLQDGLSPLSCLLMDTGGLSLEFNVSWIGEAISRLDAVLCGALASFDWDREDWGARFARD